MLKFVKPSYEELSFRQELLADPATMSYNEKWGGTISFSEDQWQDWYDWWIANPGEDFYRYLYSTELKSFVGEAGYHFDEEFNCFICDIIIKHCYRGQGFGREGLALLLAAAKENGISVIYDNIAADNPAIALFLQFGFTRQWENEDFIMLEKKL